MKRSDMVEFMLGKWTGIFPGEEWDEALKNDVRKNMSSLLAMMEYRGMKPPDNGTGNMVGRNYMSTHQDFSIEPIYEWEKE